MDAANRHSLFPDSNMEFGSLKSTFIKDYLELMIHSLFLEHRLFDKKKQFCYI